MSELNMQGQYCWVCTKISNCGIDIHHPPPVGDNCKKKEILEGKNKEVIQMTSQFVNDLEEQLKNREDYADIIKYCQNILKNKYGMSFTKIRRQKKE